MGGFTQEQYNYARYKASALDYAQSHGYELVKKGSYYVMCEHDSMVFTEDGKWFWNSRGLSGGVIEFVTNYENLSINDAILSICKGKYIEKQKNQTETVQSSESKEKRFAPPEKAENYKKMFYYLCRVRGIDSEIVQKMVRQHRIYQSKRGMNVVFVGFDEQGIPRNAFERGTWENNPYKHQVDFSDKLYPFTVPAEQQSDSVAVFEASIDALSHATLQKICGKEYDNIHRIAIGGQNDVRPIMYFLKRHPEVKKIYFCMDNDDAGRNGLVSLSTKLQEQGFSKENGYSAFAEFPKAKDWNIDLLNYKSETSELVKKIEAAIKKEKEPQKSEEAETK